MLTNVLLIAIILLVIVQIIINFIAGKKKNIDHYFKEIENYLMRFSNSLERMEISLKDEFQRNRTETNEISTKNRQELSRALKEFEQSLKQNIQDLNKQFREIFSDLSRHQKEINDQNISKIKGLQESIEKELKLIREDNSKQLEEMRITVDEKLQKTLNARLSQSFETVGKQLQAVQEGLGEMKNLAADVGGLKKVLSNVKMRGGFGEIQLSMLLEQILAPEQYEANVKTKEGSNNQVEFAIKLPGRDDSGKFVWLPIDAKFPKDVYEQLQAAQEENDPAKILVANNRFDATIKNMAKDIHEKYIDPPNTTDFGIMFLPFEGIYAEVVKKAALLEELQRNYKIIVTGPTTLAAILNSLQMGFKTLAIQKRSSEVWKILGAVKKEFGEFGKYLQKAQNNIQTGLNQLDNVIGVRTRAIQRRLRNVEMLDSKESKELLQIGEDNSGMDDEE